MKKITPFLWFDNKAEEAANFYTSLFENSEILSVNRHGEAPWRAGLGDDHRFPARGPGVRGPGSDRGREGSCPNVLLLFDQSVT